MFSNTTALGINAEEKKNKHSLGFNPLGMATRLLFKGNPPLRPSDRYQGLSQSQVDRLAALDISAYAGEVTVGGLVTVCMNTELQLDLLAFKELLDDKISSSFYQSDFDRLVQSYQRVQESITASLMDGTDSDLNQALRSIQNHKRSIGMLLLPNDFLTLLEHPSGFINTTLERVGYYAITYIQENSLMFDSEEEVYDTRDEHTVDLIKGLTVIALPDTTPIQYRESEEEFPPEVTYPSLKKTRKFNDRRALESKARLASRIYEEMKPRLARMTEQQKKQKIARLRSLRPSIRALKAFYRSKGDSPAIVNMLVTPETYPDLPQVWLTKKQQSALIDIVNGQSDKHTEFIHNGFK